MKKWIFEFFICMLLVSTCFVVALDLVSANQDGNYTYTVNNGGATITKYTGLGGAITIPSTLDGYPTVAIGEDAFKINLEITSIIIPEGVTYIGQTAFMYCSALTSITIPDSVTSIDTEVFWGCISLKFLTISDHVTRIGYRTFGGCTSLASVTIPNSVTTLGSSVFESCTSLTSVTIPNSVTTIGNRVFEYCTSLKSATIGSSVTSIGEEMFYGCSNLTSIKFLGLIAPTSVGSRWVEGTPAEIRGHAYATSTFVAPGFIWYGLTMGEVINSENEPPVASFIWVPSNPKFNQTITFDASPSSDFDGSLTLFEWDWNNDSIYEDSYTVPTTIHSWTQAGNYPVTLRVTDNNDLSTIKKITVLVISENIVKTTDNKTPGFELILFICAIIILLIFKRKKIIK